MGHDESMTHDELRDLVRQLHAEIDALRPEDGQARERLDQLVGDIEQRLEGEVNAAHQEPLADRVQDAIEEFERDHPRATGILNHIMMTLSNMGI
jgi:hypothetical protein